MRNNHDNIPLMASVMFPAAMMTRAMMRGAAVVASRKDKEARNPQPEA